MSIIKIMQQTQQQMHLFALDTNEEKESEICGAAD